MLYGVMQDGRIRVQRDGPSPAEQAQDAVAQQLQAELMQMSARLQALVGANAEQDATGRMEIRRLREEMLNTGQKLRELEARRREQVIEDAAQNMVARSLAQGTTAPVPRVEIRPGIPPEAVDISIALFVCTAAAIILFPLMRALGRILERRAAPPQRLAPAVEAQLQRMEQAIETVAIEVERISEGQRFTAKLLADRDRAAELRA